MEMRRTKYDVKLVRICLCLILIFIAFVQITAAQQLPLKYTLKDGKMFIEVSKKVNYAALDSFAEQYNLTDLPLKEILQNNSLDSLIKLGWKIEANNQQVLIISKTLFAVADINNPSQKIIFTQNPQPNLLFPENMGRIVFGYNRFKNKNPFAVNGSVVTFFLRNTAKAQNVLLAGSFSNWQQGALPMKKTDSGWIVAVNLEPGKHWYKFIIDGNWNTDNDNLLKEDDGRGNVNSVFYKTNFTFKLNGYPNARKVLLAGSFNNWKPNAAALIKTINGWQLPLYLAEGTHAYKFVVDGLWIADPENKLRLPDGENSYNSVIQFGKSHLFKLQGYSNAKQVILIGSFNGWREYELFMNKTETGWKLPYTLGAGNYEYKFIVDGKYISDPDNPAITSDIEGKANSFLIIDPNYTFKLKGLNNIKSVFLAGDFNDWNPSSIPMQRVGDSWTVSVNLTPGKHLYKLLIDGKWTIDPNNKLWEQNEYGTGNSVLWFGK